MEAVRKKKPSAISAPPKLALPIGETEFSRVLSRIAEAGRLMAESHPIDAYVSLSAAKFGGNLDIPGAGLVEGLALLELGHIAEARAALSLECLGHPEEIEAAKVARSIDAGRQWRSCAVIAGDRAGNQGMFHDLQCFYSDLGFRSFAAKKPGSADLLVIPYSGQNISLDLSAVPKGTPIHVYACSGEPPFTLLESINRYPVSVFASAENLQSGKSGLREEVVYPPVATSLWARMGPRQISFGCIGDYLKNEVLSGDFMECLQQSDVFVWGKCWEDCAQVRNWVGEIEVFGIPEIFGKSLYALEMPALQSNPGALSPVCWQAPLAGCALICGTARRLSVPGYRAWGFSQGLDRARREKPDALLIQKESLLFWLNEWERTKTAVEKSLADMPAGNVHKLPRVADAAISCASFRRFYSPC